MLQLNAKIYAGSIMRIGTEAYPLFIPSTYLDQLLRIFFSKFLDFKTVAISFDYSNFAHLEYDARQGKIQYV